MLNWQQNHHHFFFKQCISCDNSHIFSIRAKWNKDIIDFLFFCCLVWVWKQNHDETKRKFIFGWPKRYQNIQDTHSIQFLCWLMLRFLRCERDIDTLWQYRMQNDDFKFLNYFCFLFYSSSYLLHQWILIRYFTYSVFFALRIFYAIYKH